MTTFLVVAVLMTLVGVALVAIPLLRSSAGRAPIAAVCSAVAIPAAVTLLYAGVSTYPWPQPGAVDGRTADPPALQALREQATRSPGDAAAWVAFADALLAEERFAEARDAFREAVTASGGSDDGIRLSFAEAAFLADRSALAGEAGSIVEDILKRDPVNAKALWYGGMAALGRGDMAAAQTRWRRLLDLQPPPQVRQIIEQQLAQLDASAATTGAPVGPAVAATSGASIPVRVRVDPRLADRIRPGAVLFLFARGPGGAGPPLAVARRDAASLPLETSLSDADSMVPGRTIAGATELRVTARVANDGEALASPGDVFGEAVWRNGAGGGTLDILMDRVVE